MTGSVIAGRHAVRELLRTDADINKVYVQDTANK
ncbi:RNA methyltransferase substrate-binding domain-containing protein, partial [Tessaracoccus rhinocerotis]